MDREWEWRLPRAMTRPDVERVWSIHRALADKHGTNLVGNWREKSEKSNL